ncbi:elongation of very long chain fatty acids protein AAEL008004-like [Zootermopsis nevadensis]|uniref:Elongation of very long chain fatty acids protein n=1 Tax=Zootermopsis nevadensis TaxID=136037 RepID=A0A067RLC8_ZOONE|nr:elongation of very long chain fatty acids protein AAEL008004-like [Zootermopsis nevadensis]KDR20355.1 Elongation of very long chain fatty acids protein 1 [Zootermopsis nevadensis]
MATLLQNLLDRYNDLPDSYGDPRVTNWTLMRNPRSLVVILLIYLYFVLKFGPSYMKKRKPYSLKTIIQIYNIVQIVCSAVLFYGILTSGWTTRLSLGCEPVEISYDPESMRMVSLMWWTVIVKFIELIETVIFVLRKKHNQVSFLHLYHHVSTVILAWLGAKFMPGGMASFPVMINFLVHVFMYTYYFLTSLGLKWQKRTARFKKYITVIQLTQFIIMAVHALQAFHPKCNVHASMYYGHIPNIFIVYYLFYNFYKKSYTSNHIKIEK